MVTNQIMKRPMGAFFVEQRTKDSMFNATSLLKQWNEYVNIENLHTQNSGYVKLSTKDMDDFFANKNVQEFIIALIDEENLNATKCAYVKSRARSDRGGGTWMHPILFVKFAMWLNPRFEVQVIKFVYDQMLKYRNDAGDAYRELASAVAKIVPHKDLSATMKHIAKGLNYIIFDEHQHDMRNQYGDESKMRELFAMEKQIAMLINDGFITNTSNLLKYLRKKYSDRHTPKCLR